MVRLSEFFYHIPMIDAAILIILFYLYLYSEKVTVLNPLQTIATVAVFLYTLISIFKPNLNKKIFKAKYALILLIICYTVGNSFITELYSRCISAPHMFTHDHALQLEEGLKFLSEGKNPYSHDYTDTPMALWEDWDNNPALYHFISLPSHLYLSIPFYYISNTLFSWYDQRVIHLLSFIFSLFIVYRLFDRREDKILATITFGLNPLLVPHFIEGLDDIIFISLLLFSLLLLKKKHFQSSLIFLALAITTKHSAWFISPFHFLHIWQSGYFKKHLGDKIIPFILIITSSILPFMLWDYSAFLDDVYYYPAGNLPTSYPIKGIGLSNFLVNHGIILNDQAYFPFYLFQLLLLPLLYLLIRHQINGNQLSLIFINYAIFIWAFWFLSRFFNTSYVSVISVFITLGALLWINERRTIRQ